MQPLMASPKNKIKHGLYLKKKICLVIRNHGTRTVAHVT